MAFGNPHVSFKTLQNPDNLCAGQRGVDLHGRAFPAEVINYIEGAKPGASGQHIIHEVHGPAFADPSGQLDRLAVGRADPLPLAFTCL